MHGRFPREMWAQATSTGRRIAVTVLILVAIAAALYYVFAPTAQQSRANRGRFAADGPVPVLAAPAQRVDVPVYLDAVGTTRALNTVTVRPQVDGKLISVNFKEGDDVKKGDVIAKIDPTTFKAALEQAIAKKAQDQAQLTNARLDLDRYEKLAATNSINRQQADTQKALVAQLEALVNSDQAAIDNAQAILGYTTILAPLDGRTGIRQVDEGNIVHASDATGIVTITQVKPISVLFNLPQQNLQQVNTAFAKGPLGVDAQRSDTDAVIDRGSLIVVDNQVDQSTGTVRLKADFPNANLQLWPGQFVNVRLLIDTLKQVVVIPTGAVQRGPNGTFVFVVKDDNTAAIRPVTISQQDETQAVVTQGVQPAERVVTTGFARLTDGSPVTVSAPGETPTPAAAGAPARRSGTGGERRRRQDGAAPGAPGAPSAPSASTPANPAPATAPAPGAVPPQ
jgi:multidrug efflux system membrane fusion protein